MQCVLHESWARVIWKRAQFCVSCFLSHSLCNLHGSSFGIYVGCLDGRAYSPAGASPQATWVGGFHNSLPRSQVSLQWRRLFKLHPEAINHSGGRHRLAALARNTEDIPEQFLRHILGTSLWPFFLVSNFRIQNVLHHVLQQLLQSRLQKCRIFSVWDSWWLYCMHASHLASLSLKLSLWLNEK